MSDVTTNGSTLIDILKSLDAEWTKDNWPHDEDPRPRSYYAVAADRIAELEAALRVYACEAGTCQCVDGRSAAICGEIAAKALRGQGGE